MTSSPDLVDQKLAEPTIHRESITSLEAPAYIQALSNEERIRAEKALVRKIDFRLLPAIIIMYIMNYLDRVRINHARMQFHDCVGDINWRKSLLTSR
jgi:hypothetical protein